MTPQRTSEYFVGIVRELCKLPGETEWLEFKENVAEPQEIGEYISALANSAALLGKNSAYVVWGIEDKTHKVTGTSFSPRREKVGNEELENWLLRLLAPKIGFKFCELEIDGASVVLLEIGRAFPHPVRFQGEEYIRVGSYKKKLKDVPEKERELWRCLDRIPFERLIAKADVGADEVAKCLDYTSYFDLLKLPVPTTQEAIISALESDGMVVRAKSGRWDITNHGAVLFAKNLGEFASLARKAVRVVVYKGSSRVESIREQQSAKGYAAGFDGLISYIDTLLPTNEVIEKAFRRTVPMYPQIAVRELVANALIHQDFSITGTGPMIEIFDGRMEVTNPGEPLVVVDRFLDLPPRSRNETLASFMRRVGICEERGSGVDKVVLETEIYQLPAPKFEVWEGNTRSILFSHRRLTKMDKEDRIRACYLHACLRYVSNDFMTNTSLRERFGIDPKNSSTISRYIKEAVESVSGGVK